MTDRTRPTLLVYRRATCHLCDEAEGWLQAYLEDRARASQPLPAVRRIDVDMELDEAERARLGALVPVLALGGVELPLVTSPRQLRAFLDRTLPALA